MKVKHCKVGTKVILLGEKILADKSIVGYSNLLLPHINKIVTIAKVHIVHGKTRVSFVEDTYGVLSKPNWLKKIKPVEETTLEKRCEILSESINKALKKAGWL